MKKSADKAHPWTFFRYEGVLQVVLQNGEDLRHLRELDLKLWMALTMPVKGTIIDEATSAAIDTDKDGRIHRDEILDALDWVFGVIRDPGLLVKSADTIALADITDDLLRASAEDSLRRMGKDSQKEISFADARGASEAFAKTAYNGDGIVLPDLFADNARVKALAEAIVKVLPGTKDRCGKDGINADNLAGFRKQAQEMLAWLAKADAAAAGSLDVAATAKASAAIHAVESKVEDFFTRCRLADFDAKSADPLNRSAADYQVIAGKALSKATPELAEFPLATVAPGASLPLLRHVNPAWAGALSTFLMDAVRPVLGDDELMEITEEQWLRVKASVGAYDAYMASKPAGAIGGFDAATLTELLSDADADVISKAITQDASYAKEAEVVGNVEKLLRFRRDLPTILQNFVSFAPFYAGEKAIFQTGVLFVDGRCCELCVDVVDEGKHGVMAPQSGFYLAYCDVVRPGLPKRKIAATITDGDCDNLMVGRNGLFVDHKGLVWDATIAKIVAAPVSIREAFWSPYKKLVRFIEDQINKRAMAADAAANAKIEAGATNVVTTTATGAVAAPVAPPAEGPKKVDLGTIALIGTAIGGVSALVAGFLKTLFGLGWWLPLGVLGVLLLISGPSMILAMLKLRRRNLAPILDANGWAINTRARINIPFASHLTPLATLPDGTIPTISNPFEKKGRRRMVIFRRILWTILALVILGGTAWRLGAYEWLKNRFAPKQEVVCDTVASEEVISDEATEATEAEPPAEVVEEAPAAAEAPTADVPATAE